MSRRSGKKSLIGLRVAALIGNGYFAPATIMSTKSHGSEDTYIVKFDDNTSCECIAKDMIGTNFGSVSDVYLQRFQKHCRTVLWRREVIVCIESRIQSDITDFFKGPDQVYTTHNGREVSGYIQHYQDDQILISIPDKTEGKEIISKKPDEVRLLDSRRSQRLQGSNPMDYKKMSEEGSTCKRPISASIEVPQHGPRIRRTSEEPTMTELMAAMVLSTMSSSPVFHNFDGPKESAPPSFDSCGTGNWTQDSKHTSPSRQPASKASPQFSTHTMDSAHDESRHSEHESLPRSSTPDDLLDADSGMILLQRLIPTPKSNEDKFKNTDYVDEPQDLRVPKTQKEQAVSPRPPSHSSQSSSEPGRLEVVMEQEDQQSVPIPTTVPLVLPARPLQVPISYYIPSGILHQPFPSSLPTEFRVHMVGSHSIQSPQEFGSSAPGHIDNKMHRHLHRTAPYKINDDSAVTSSPGGGSPSKITYGSAPASYYHFRNTPIPVASLSFSPSHHVKHARSPLASKSQTSPVTTSTTKPRELAERDRAYSSSLPAQPITIPVSQSYSWQSPTTNFTSKSVVTQRQQLHGSASPKMTFQVSPKSLPLGRKVRGDGKKCRKVYGMENRDLWCTACKWKKACQRFPD